MGNSMGWVCSNGIVRHRDNSISKKKNQLSEDRKADFSLISNAKRSIELPGKAFSDENGILLPSPAAKTGRNKVAPMNSQGGKRARAVEVLKTIGNSVSILHTNSGFCTSIASNGREISILAFEIANTISKLANLSQSLSDENIQLFKIELSQSEGIKQLVSNNMEELLSIAAADKRQEFDILLREVIRFGKQCNNPQWHNLDAYFSRLDLNSSTQKQVGEARAALQLQELTVLSHSTSELYHELIVLERFEQDYRRKAEEVESLNQAGLGEGLTILQGELNLKRKLVRSLQNKSLWSRNLDEIVEKLVNVVTLINQTMSKAFGSNSTAKTLPVEDRSTSSQKLGVAGLALHYAGIINQISIIACRPTSIPSNMRDALYRALPTSVKTALRSQLQSVDVREEPTYSSVIAEMDKILRWLYPIAANTSKAHQACGRIGEWATNSKEIGKGRAIQSSSTSSSLIRLQTFYHADKEKTDQYILKLVTSLNHLIYLARQQHQRFTPLRNRSPAPKDMVISQSNWHRVQFKSHIIRSLKDGVTAENRTATNQLPVRNRDPGNNKGKEWCKDEKKDKGIWTLSKGFEP